MPKVMIKVQYVPIITDVTQTEGEEVVLQEATLKGLLNCLGEQYGEAMKNLLWDSQTLERSQFVLTVVNGDLIHSVNLPLKNGDTVLIMPAIAGG